MAPSSAAPDAKSTAPEGDATEAPKEAKASNKAAQVNDDEEEAQREPEISLHQFLRVSGVQPDQSAGFVRWAHKNMSGRYGLSAWKQALADFWRAPAR
jgi:hypothetical protein